MEPLKLAPDRTKFAQMFLNYLKNTGVTILNPKKYVVVSNDNRELIHLFVIYYQ